jgi:starvation-inducible DNA-binding protein
VQVLDNVQVKDWSDMAIAARTAKAASEQIGILEGALSGTVYVYLLVKTAHWNIRGPRFIALHELFDEVAQSMLEFVDVVAERIGALDAPVTGALPQSLEQQDLALKDLTEDGYLELVHSLLARRVGELRDEIEVFERAGDFTTVDILTDVLRETEKQAWLVRSHISPSLNTTSGRLGKATAAISVRGRK